MSLFIHILFDIANIMLALSLAYWGIILTIESIKFGEPDFNFQKMVMAGIWAIYCCVSINLGIGHG